MDTLPTAALLPSIVPGAARAVLETAAQRPGDAVLALVVETEGSTYVRAGAVALFAEAMQIGWLSGGCLEPEIARRAALAAQQQAIEWLDIDTRDDEDLFAGSAIGCRGRLHLALLPLAALPGWPELVTAWRDGNGALRIGLDTHGAVAASVGALARQWTLTTSVPMTSAAAAERRWQVELAPPPTVLVLGAGPETPTLLPWLRRLGWMTTMVERRPRWVGLADYADVAIAQAPSQALHELAARHFDAALVMHHHFELDREALQALAGGNIAFIGLLGPVRRREDLFRVLPEAARTALAARLHSPVGLDLGGQGPEAIALSIAAQLQGLRPRR